MTSLVYQLNVFGKYWPEHGKKIFKNKGAMLNRLAKYKAEVRAKWGKIVSDDLLTDNLNYGFLMTSIDTEITPHWEKLFEESNFKKNDYKIGDKWNEFDE